MFQQEKNGFFGGLAKARFLMVLEELVVASWQPLGTRSKVEFFQVEVTFFNENEVPAGSLGGFWMVFRYIKLPCHNTQRGKS